MRICGAKVDVGNVMTTLIFVGMFLMHFAETVGRNLVRTVYDYMWVSRTMWSVDQYVTGWCAVMLTQSHMLSSITCTHYHKPTEQGEDAEGAMTARYLHHTDGALDHLLVLWLWPANITANLVTRTNSRKGCTWELTSLIDICPLSAKISGVWWKFEQGSRPLKPQTNRSLFDGIFLSGKASSAKHTHTHWDAHNTSCLCTSWAPSWLQ